MNWMNSLTVDWAYVMSLDIPLMIGLAAESNIPRPKWRLGGVNKDELSAEEFGSLFVISIVSR